MPALERYDSPAFRVLWRYLRRQPDPELDVCILSAEFGLISSDQCIPHDDRQVTPQRARELRPQVRSVLDRVLPDAEVERFNAADVLVVASKDSLSALLLARLGIETERL